MADCKAAATPMEERLRLSRDSTVEKVDATLYRRIVGSLRYLIHTRPDLTYAVGYVSRFLERPIEEHLQTMKKIIRWLVGCCDSDHAGDIDTRKSTTDALFFLSKSLVS
jgi:hypothetical protein